MRDLLDGEEVTSPPGRRYAFDHLRILPAPVQAHVPMMIGGGGERKTLRIVAQYADMWNVFGTPETVAAKDADPARSTARTSAATRTPSSARSAARSRSARPRPRRSGSAGPRSSTTGRRSSRVEGDVSFWTGTPEQIAETMVAYRRVGFDTFIVELPAPYDAETMESLMTVVKPMVSPVAR